MDNKNNLDWNATNIEIMRENIIQNEKNIREQEYTIQSIAFTRMYETRMNRKVWSFIHSPNTKPITWNIKLNYKKMDTK